MDSLSIAQFNEGFDFAINQSLPVVGSLIVLGVLIYVVKRDFPIMTYYGLGIFAGILFAFALFETLKTIFR